MNLAVDLTYSFDINILYIYKFAYNDVVCLTKKQLSYAANSTVS